MLPPIIFEYYCITMIKNYEEKTVALYIEISEKS